MGKHKKILVLWLVLMMGVMACGFSMGDELDETEKLQTSVAETITAVAQDQKESQVVVPTDTSAPTGTPQPATATPKPCNKAEFVSETVEDGSKFDVGENFTKTWRLRNVGTCTWNTNYKLIFSSGDKMSGPSSKNLPQSVAPGEMVDISVDLKAPNTEGTYKGVWQIQDDQGQTFVYNIWVEIKAKAILGPPPLAKADLAISEFSLNPPTPNMGANVHVRVRAKNNGIADSGAFKMEWYGLSTFANPSCSWNILGGLVAGGSVLMECDFSFASWYPINKTTIAYIDVGNQVDETNEGNNTASISPFGVNP